MDWKLRQLPLSGLIDLNRLFKPFKWAGPDGIFPALLKEGLEEIMELFTRLLRTCITLEYISRAWLGIHLDGWEDKLYAGDFRPICLSFLLKMLEKLVDVYVREIGLVRHPLHSNQHGSLHRDSSSLGSASCREVV